MTPVIYRPEAESDVEDAWSWYEARRPGLGSEFLLALKDAEAAIAASPTAYREIHRGARRYLLSRFPYQLIYRVLPDAILVVACFHIRRSPRRLRERH